MNIEEFKTLIEEKTEELSFGIGVEKNKLPEMKYNSEDVKLLEGVKEKGEVVISDGALKATGLAARVASAVFIQYGDDEAEYIIEEEAARDARSSQMKSFHFIKAFDEEEWQCYKTVTEYQIDRQALSIKGFDIEEIAPELGRTDDLDELVKVVHSKDRDLTENKAEHVKNSYYFQSGGRSEIGER